MDIMVNVGECSCIRKAGCGLGWLVGWYPVVRVQHPPEGRILEMAKDIRFGFGTWSGWW